MKKVYLALLILLLALSACNATPKPKDEASNFTSQPSTTSIIALTFYPPELIKVAPESDFDLAYHSYIPKYRAIYNVIHGEVSDLFDHARSNEFEDLLTSKHMVNGIYVESDEMDTVTAVKFFNISREDFEEAIRREWDWKVQYALERGIEIELDDEGCELPNPDIIYTFDNEIINAHYRRENPVVPDWLKEAAE
ncbi:MAG: hypothetical protein FWE97_04845 [Dehalococcoidia bacterium]|nr:hypothetical protein [Dehalococcoidia bacterium]